MIVTAWQRALEGLAEEKEVRFGREKSSVSVSVLEDDRGFRVESRLGRKKVSRIDIGCRDEGFSVRLRSAISRATAEAQARLMEAL